ncbi:MAG: CYTH domain-containing protein [Proteobacteria bacterium]|nr:CYTH domain-containing protein [Pseudomonadota bacterium]MBS0465320.1 CYTH domain-containing protein [Pseudomonadota bacterium]
MGIEIERKFLVVGDAWRGAVEKSVRMAQGYLNDAAAPESTAKSSLRVRIAGAAAFINIKSRQSGPERAEFEYAIPLADAQALLELCVGGLIDKTRHYVHHAGFLWEIDEFAGDNIGLIVAEIELPRVDATFATPGWAGREVTDAPRYYNHALARRPFARWADEEKS